MHPINTYQRTRLASYVLLFNLLFSALPQASADEPLWNLPTPAQLNSSAGEAASHSLITPSVYDETEVAENTSATMEYWHNTANVGCPEQSSRLWLTADYLLLWTNGNPTPPLLTTNSVVPPRNQAGVLGFADTQVLVGGRIDEGGRSGVSLSTGYWLDDSHCSALQATWWYVGDPADELNDVWTSLGSPVLARPFFNVGSGLEDSQLVAYPNVVAGSIQITSGSDIRSFETLLSANCRKGCNSRIDLLAGYRYFRFREGLYIEENLIATDPGGAVQQGTTIDVYDQFLTSNSFHGASLGVQSSYEHGWLQFDVATKLGLGNVRRRLAVAGATVVTTPSNSQTSFTGGLLALPSNIGTRKDDAFGLLPELNLNGRLLLTDHMTLNLGYNLMFLTNVYRSGKQIDRLIDPGLLAGGMPINGNTPNSLIHPAPTMDSATLCVQGLNLGCTFTY